MQNEEKFYESLQNTFVGKPTSGDGGYVNLLRIKEKYYKKVLGEFKAQVNADTVVSADFKDDFFGMLYSFFQKYFSECGSVYFVQSASWQKVYEKIYTDNKDVVLFWKTHMLYYVKSDILFDSIFVTANKPNTDEDYVFYFDVGNLKQKQNNAKKELVFTYRETRIGKAKDKEFVFTVSYKEGNKRIDSEAEANKAQVDLSVLEAAIAQFKKQNTVDFFINKNAGRFLNEQLDLFLHQYLLETCSQFDQARLDQLKAVKRHAQNIIAFIGQFENELARIWNKPKFVLNSNYVISLATLKMYISEKKFDDIYKQFLSILKNNAEYKGEIEKNLQKIYQRPLQKLYIRNFSYDKDGISFEYFNQETNSAVKNDYENSISYIRLYIDTKYFSKRFVGNLLEAVQKNHVLSDILDGQIIMSDNYHALKCIKKLLRNKIRLIYIDPPFNTDNPQFAYMDSYLDSTWLSFINDRLGFVDGLLSPDGSFYIHLDSNGNHLFRMLNTGLTMRREIIWNTSPSPSGFKTKAKNFIRQHDNIYYYTRDDKPVFNKLWRPKSTKDTNNWLDIREDGGGQYFLRYKDGKLQKEYIKAIDLLAIGDVWNDIYSMMYSQNMTREIWGDGNTQKPENLLRRIIETSTNEKDTVLDFFGGTGTTIAAAHKLNRKWVCVELAEYVESIIVERMKTVITGDFRTKLSEDTNWQGGGFFKYYALEQYEDTLARMIYSQDKGDVYAKDVFNQYIFFADKKLTDVLSISGMEINLDFNRLFEGKTVDLAETISLLFGKPIAKISEDYVCLSGLEKPIKTNPAKMTKDERVEFCKLVKTLLWWGE